MTLWFKVLMLLCINSIFISNSAYAQIGSNWTFSLPQSNISGAAGLTIGWGYTITNNSTNWLWATDLTSTSVFQHGTATTNPFDLPVLAPGTSVEVDYTGNTGLADLTWDSNAPVGYVNAGKFQLTSYYYDGDPFAGGSYIGSAGTQEADYQASVSSPVPEASSIVSFGLLLLLGTGGAVWGVRRRTTA